MIQKIKEKIMQDRRIDRSSLDAFLEILKEVESEFGKDINVRSNWWISCEKELPPQPEENQEFDGKPLELYLVSFKDTKYPWRAFWNGKNFTDGWSIVHPEAWMPLASPYTPTTD